jgi:hypothetical protein
MVLVAMPELSKALNLLVVHANSAEAVLTTLEKLAAFVSFVSE